MIRYSTAPERSSADPRLRLAVLALGLVLGGCKIVILSGPTTVTIGDTVVYELEVSEAGFGFDPVPVVVADVPLGWELQASSFTTTIDGLPVSGGGVAFMSTVCNAELGALRPGYRRWHLRPDTDDDELIGAESGRVTVELLVTDQPADGYEIFFAFGNTEGCSLPTGAAINRGPSFLTLLQTFVDGASGVDGLSGPGEAMASSDGRHLYVPGGVDGSVAAFSRDPASGALTFLGSVDDGAGGVTGMAVPRGLAESPDEQHVYVASLSNPDTGDQGGTALFTRDPADGALTFVERLLEDVEYVLVSPDGRHLYASAGGVTAYSRDETNGELTFVEAEFPGGKLMMSADGRHLYVAAAAPSIDFTEAYTRDDVTGELTSIQTTTGGRTSALTPDGRHIYIVSPDSSSVTVLDRDEATGALSFAFTELVEPPFSIQPQALAISPDGSHVIVAGGTTVAVLQRNRVSGELTRVESHHAFNLSVTELEGARSLAFGPAGRQLYLTSLLDDALLVFETAILFHDGFESGNVAAWSAAAP